MKIIDIPKEYSKYPGGRYRKDGKYSGEQFRDDVLLPLLKDGENITVVLDGASGYSSSFLEETFGGLVRQGIAAEKLQQSLRFKATGVFAIYEGMIWNFIKNAGSAAAMENGR